jgi:glycosyltransferase involved in cell wall biosynthesis
VLAGRLERLRRSFAVDLVHAHYAVPAGDAVRRVAPELPLVVSVHGGDVFGPHASSRAVHMALAHARLVLANSAGTARRSEARGARRTRVVHLGGNPPCGSAPQLATPTLVTVADLIPRKRQADVIAALAVLRVRHPDLRYVLVGEGPEHERLRARAIELGVADRVELLGRLAPPEAVAVARAGSLFVLPSVAEAFGVAYVEAMAGGVPAIGSRGEEGPEEIAAAGGGIALVPAGDVNALAAQIDTLLSNPPALEAMGQQARENVEREFTWEKCGRETLQAYEQALAEE